MYINFEFEFGENIKLKKYFDSWRKHRNYRGFVILGPSGSGKTAFLNKLCSELQNVYYIEGWKLIEQICDEILTCNLYKPPVGSHDVLLIDSLDDIEGKEATTNEVCHRIRQNTYNNKGEERLIVCTFIRYIVAKKFAKKMNYELIYLEKVKPNLRIVRDKARELGLKFNELQMRALADSDNMFELQRKFTKIEFNEYMGKIKSESKP